MKNGSSLLQNESEEERKSLFKFFSKKKVYSENMIDETTKREAPKFNGSNTTDINIPNFEKVLAIKLREERLKEITSEFSTEKFNTDDFRKHFLLKNRKWVRDNLKLVFTPSTIKL